VEGCEIVCICVSIVVVIGPTTKIVNSEVLLTLLVTFLLGTSLLATHLPNDKRFTCGYSTIYGVIVVGCRARYQTFFFCFWLCKFWCCASFSH
jgi:hypothetical protein